eukprot:TRINITY_DN5987_c0_g1_i1.p1 TRINITY_DN5987_c0_g1~~TRINITY_DN5987_c0_g1_i1.p1  ORF type:complete len:546 (+),score=109.84 TRINITY_DN5987_c0_g1_i1:140-1777(+)
MQHTDHVDPTLYFDSEMITQGPSQIYDELESLNRMIRNDSTISRTPSIHLNFDFLFGSSVSTDVRLQVVDTPHQSYPRAQFLILMLDYVHWRSASSISYLEDLRWRLPDFKTIQSDVSQRVLVILNKIDARTYEDRPIKELLLDVQAQLKKHSDLDLTIDQIIPLSCKIARKIRIPKQEMHPDERRDHDREFGSDPLQHRSKSEECAIESNFHELYQIFLKSLTAANVLLPLSVSIDAKMICQEMMVTTQDQLETCRQRIMEEREWEHRIDHCNMHVFHLCHSLNAAIDERTRILTENLEAAFGGVDSKIVDEGYHGAMPGHSGKHLAEITTCMQRLQERDCSYGNLESQKSNVDSACFEIWRLINENLFICWFIIRTHCRKTKESITREINELVWDVGRKMSLETPPDVIRIPDINVPSITLLHRDHPHTTIMRSGILGLPFLKVHEHSDWFINETRSLIRDWRKQLAQDINEFQNHLHTTINDVTMQCKNHLEMEVNRLRSEYMDREVTIRQLDAVRNGIDGLITKLQDRRDASHSDTRVVRA